MEENAALLRRIVSGKPTISRKQALRERKQNQQYMLMRRDDSERQKRLAISSLRRSAQTPAETRRIAWGEEGI